MYIIAQSIAPETSKRGWMALDAFYLRRRLLTTLGGQYSLGPRYKVIFSLLIFLVSFSIKSLHAVDLSPVMHTREQPAGGMGDEYDREAVSILDGHGLLVPDNWDASDTTLLRHAPGYGIYLAAIYAVLGKNFFNIQFVQNVVNSLSPILIFLIAGTLLTWPVGIVSGLLAAVSHHFAYYSNFILPDSICALPILAAVYLLVRSKNGRPRAGRIYMLAGVMLGLSVWLRPNALLIGVFIAALLILMSTKRRQEARRAWIIAAIPFAVISPITIRNYIIYGEFVPLSANLGIVLWEGIANQSGNRFGAVGGMGGGRAGGHALWQSALRRFMGFA